MTTYLVTRHEGAIEWAKQNAIHFDQLISHLEILTLVSGDTVIGTLPVHVVAELNNINVCYFHIVIDMPENMRGKEMNASTLNELNAKISQYIVKKI